MNMTIYNMPRASGKTTYLINKSQKTGYPIVVVEHQTKRYIIETANKMGLVNVQVFTVDEILKGGLRGRKKIDGLLVDDLDFVLQKLFGTSVKIATITTEEKD